MSRALRYSARKPKPANAALEWPEGKDICASLTSRARPVQRVAAVCYAAGAKADGFEGRGGVRGWQAAYAGLVPRSYLDDMDLTVAEDV